MLQLRRSDGNAKRGRDGQTMLLPLGVSKAVNKGFSEEEEKEEEKNHGAVYARC